MFMPNFDDGFDLFAPPTPEGSPEHPPKLCVESERPQLWVMPLALMVSTGISVAIIWLVILGIFRLLK